MSNFWLFKLPKIARIHYFTPVQFAGGRSINGTDGFQAILRQAGCHIYNDKNDFTYANNGLLLLHTKDGGPRTIHFRSGKTIPLTMPRLRRIYLTFRRLRC